MKRSFALVVLLLACLPSALRSAPLVGDRLSLRNEIAHAISRGAGWLQAQQAEQGWWSNADHPALSALPLWALANVPPELQAKIETNRLDRGYRFLLGCEVEVHVRRSCQWFGAATC